MEERRGRAAGPNDKPMDPIINTRFQGQVGDTSSEERPWLAPRQIDALLSRQREPSRITCTRELQHVYPCWLEMDHARSLRIRDVACAAVLVIILIFLLW